MRAVDLELEPEVLMDGSSSLERCQEVTAGVLKAVFDETFDDPGAVAPKRS
jgi:fructose-bisphosphate aldolase class 1